MNVTVLRGTPEEALNRAVLRIRGGPGPDTPVSGAGLLVAPDVAVTCAHVVSDALRQRRRERPSRNERIRLELPFAGSSTAFASASVEHWVPEAEDGAGDIAVLRLDAELAGAGPLRMVESKSFQDHRVLVPGFPKGLEGGVWHVGQLLGRTEQGWVQISPHHSPGVTIVRGFSGAPVWDEELGDVVGIVVAAQRGGAGQGFLIPTRTLTTAVPSLAAMVRPASPFRGLEAFREDDEEVFFGRTAQAKETARLVRANPQVVMVGPSGCGKSSLALAGVVPLMRREGFQAVVVRPSAGRSWQDALAAELSRLLHPELTGVDALSKARELRPMLAEEGLGEVSRLVLRDSRATRLLVVIDQAEELLVGAPEDAEAAARILFAEQQPQDVRVLLTLRADFLEAGLTDPALGSALSRAVCAPLAPMNREQLKEVIERPLESIPSVSYDPGLAEEILDDAGSGPGALPLLSFVLERLWQKNSGGRIHFDAYQELGKVNGALARHAEDVWQRCVPDPAMGQRLLSQLVRVPPGTEAPLKRVISRAEAGEDRWRIVQELADRRLLVVRREGDGPKTVELAHESLISAWPRLAEQVAADIEFLKWHEGLRLDLKRWQEARRAVGRLPGPAELAAAERWVAERRGDLGAAELDYLEQGRRHQRFRSARRRAKWIGLGTLLALVAVLVPWLIYQGKVSEERAAEARSRALAKISADLAERRPDLSAMLAIGAYRASPTREARGQLLRQYLQYRDVRGVVSGALGAIAGADASSDGRVVLVTPRSDLGQGRATLYVRSQNGGYTRTYLPDRGRTVSQPAVSADGTVIAYTDKDGNLIWHAVEPSGGGLMDQGHALGWTERQEPDGAPQLGADIKLTRDDGWIATTGRDSVVVQSLGTVEPEQSWTINFPAESVHFGPGEDKLAVLHDGGAWVLRSKGDPLWSEGAATHWLGRAEDLRVSGDGTTAVTCVTSKDRTSATYTALRVSNGKELGRYRGATECQPFAVDDTGQHVAVVGASGWELVDLRHSARLSTTWIEAQQNPTPLALVAAAAGPELMTMSPDTVVFTQLRQHEERSGTPALLGDGRRMVAQTEDGEKLRLSETGGRQRTVAEVRRADSAPGLDAHGEPMLDDQERYVADPVAANRVVVRRLPSLRVVRQVTTAMPPPDGDENGQVQPIFADDGDLLTLAGRRLERWDHSTGRREMSLDLAGPGTALAGVQVSPWNPEHLLVSVHGRDYIQTIDLRSGRELTKQRMRVGSGTVTGFTFDAEARYMLVFRSSAQPEVWQTRPLKKVLGPLRSLSEDTSNTVAHMISEKSALYLFSGTEIRIYGLGGADDGIGHDGVVLEDAYTFTLPQEFLDVSADGRTLLRVKAGDWKTGFVTDVLRLDHEGEWEQRLCEVLGRAFTEEDQAQVPVELPGPVCPR